MKTTLSISVFLFSCWFSQTASAGFDFTPIIANLDVAGQGATASFVLTNSEANKLAVQITIVNREPDINGKEEYKESEKVDEQFRVFPSQVVLEPKETRTVRVTYIGTPAIKSELPFRIIAEELPVDLDDPTKKYTRAIAKITLSTRYIGSLYVTPKVAKPDIVIDAKKSEANDNEMILEITNKGTAHQVYRKPVVKILEKSSGKTFTMLEEETKPLMSQNVLAGRSRRFVLPWPKGIAAGPIKVTLDVPKD